MSSIKLQVKKTNKMKVTSRLNLKLQKDNQELLSLLAFEKYRSRKFEGFLAGQITRAREFESLLAAERTCSWNLENLLVAEMTRLSELETGLVRALRASEMLAEGDLGKAAPGVWGMTRLWEERAGVLLERKLDPIPEEDEDVEDQEVEDQEVEDEEVEDEKVEGEEVEDEKLADEEVADEKVEDEKVETQESRPRCKKSTVTITLFLEEDPVVKERHRREQLESNLREKEREPFTELEVLGGKKEEVERQLEVKASFWWEQKALLFCFNNRGKKELQQRELELQTVTNQLTRIQNRRWYHRLIPCWGRSRAET